MCLVFTLDELLSNLTIWWPVPDLPKVVNSLNRSTEFLHSGNRAAPPSHPAAPAPSCRSNRWPRESSAPALQVWPTLSPPPEWPRHRGRARPGRRSWQTYSRTRRAGRVRPCRHSQRTSTRRSPALSDDLQGETQCRLAVSVWARLSYVNPSFDTNCR